jgi:FkbM family methyltransferase
MKKLVYKWFLTLLSPLKGHGLRDYAVVRFALSLLKPRTVKINGFNMYIDRTDETLSRALMSGSYEPNETRVMMGIVTSGMTVVDIGANIGYYTLLFARAVGEGGLVYAFEPAPETFALLRRNLHVNKLDRIVELHEEALSDNEGGGELFINEYNKGNNRLYDSGGMRSAPIRLKRLDDVVPISKHVDFIKMDIEGAEVLALRGMHKLLARDKPTIVMEYWPRRFKKLNTTAEEMFEMLEALGYKFWDIEGETGNICHVTAGELQARYPMDRDGGTNFICSVKQLDVRT